MKTRLLILTILIPALLVGWGCFTGVRALISPQDSRALVNPSPAVLAPIAAQTPKESPADVALDN